MVQPAGAHRALLLIASLSFVACAPSKEEGSVAPSPAERRLERADTEGGHPALSAVDDPALRAALIREHQAQADETYALTDLGGGAYRGENSAQGLELEVRGGDVVVRSNAVARGGRFRLAAGGDFELGLRLTRWGARGALEAVGDVVESHVERQRIELARPSGLEEWYENGPLGIEQGFTVERAPGAGDELLLDVEIEGARALALGGGSSREIVLLSEGGELRLGELFAQDALGKPLPASFETLDTGVRIAVSVRDARWPVEVDPLLWIDEPRLSPWGFGAPHYGLSVATTGDLALIGARGDGDEATWTATGAAYVFARSGASWSLEQKLTATDGAAGDQFGDAVTLAGDLALVGALGDDANRGAAYVFARTGTSWTQQQKLTAADGAANDYFGSGVSLSGESALIGAEGDDSYRGGAYVFVKSGASWSQQQKLTANSGGSLDFFGASTALSGDSALVGAPDYDTASGNAYVFTRTGTTWTQQQRLTAGSGSSGNRFGYAVSLAGDAAFVGAHGASNASGDFVRGAAYAYTRSGTTWTQQQKLTASDGSINDDFGYALAFEGDTAHISDPAGAVYVFARTGATWAEQQKVTSGEGSASFLGMSVSLAGETALVGAGDSFSRGSAYVFTRSGAIWSQQQKMTGPEVAANDRFGQSVSVSSDTALVGAPGDEGFRGSIYAYERTGGSWTEQLRLTASDGLSNDAFGKSVSQDGDSAVIGASGDDSTRGAAYVFVRDGSGWSEQQKLTASDGAAGDSFGTSVSLAGDSALVGAYTDDSNRGSAYLFERSGSGWTQAQRLTANGGISNDHFGISVALSDDAAVIGAHGYVSIPGAAFVFARSGAGFVQQQKLTANDAAANDAFGISVGVAGDTAVVGAWGDDSARGSAYVFKRTGVTWTQQQKVTTGDVAAGAQFGGSVSLYGSTLVVGATKTNTGKGAAYVFMRSGVSWSQTQRLTAGSATNNYNFGVSVALADGVALVGADGAQHQGSFSGAAFPFHVELLADGSACPEGASVCDSGHCVDGVCCNEECTGTCERCDATPGVCTSVTSGSDPDTCPSPSSCDAGGACKKQTGQPCSASGECASGHCVDEYCCNDECDGECDVCDATPGSCTVLGAGNPGIPSCTPYLCSGSSGDCPVSCDADSDCVAESYCAAGGTCQPRKDQGDACNAAAGQDCLVGGCRVCDTPGGCVDGYCCNTACSNACDVCAQALGAPANGTCGNAPDEAAGSPSCAPYLCTGSGSNCGSSCADDDDCVANHYCDQEGSECHPDQGNGAACTRDSQCSSGHCADGVCCNEECDGACQACTAELKQSGVGDGQCGDAKAGSDPHDDCADEGAASCARDGQCDGSGACRLYQQGVACEDDNTCVGNSAVGHVCDGMGSCVLSAGGVDCSPYVCPTGGTGCSAPCAASGDCVAGYFCDEGTCRLEKEDGEACAGDGECESGHCVEGVCCNSACDAGCESCLAANKASGADDGTCGPAAAGTDPGNDCDDDGASTCGNDGLCDGAGACRLYPTGTECQPNACTGDAGDGFELRGYACDGAGTCDDAVLEVCGWYECATTGCGSDCASDDDCIDGAWCSDGECRSRDGLGEECDQDAQCESGFCVDGFCCDSACEGQCEACDSSGAEGLCVAVIGAPHGDREACTDELCGANECDGEERDECAKFADASVVCQAAACADGIATSEARCDGAGSCGEATSVDCGDYACGETECKTSCASDSDCISGLSCEDGECVTPVAAGCTSDADCGEGYTCDDGNCVENAPRSSPSAGEESGCGCRLHRSRSDTPGALLFALVGLCMTRVFRSRRSRRKLVDQCGFLSSERARP